LQPLLLTKAARLSSRLGFKEGEPDAQGVATGEYGP
jgi:hypothetical protein